jgi:UDP-galactopyranose mutase
MEIPSLNGRHYPLPFKADQDLARKYFALMPEHVYSIGRNGSYRYGLDIDDCIEQAMIMAKQITEGGRDYPVPMEIWR